MPLTSQTTKCKFKNCLKKSSAKLQKNKIVWKKFVRKKLSGKISSKIVTKILWEKLIKIKLLEKNCQKKLSNKCQKNCKLNNNNNNNGKTIVRKNSQIKWVGRNIRNKLLPETGGKNIRKKIKKKEYQQRCQTKIAI